MPALFCWGGVCGLAPGWPGPGLSMCFSAFLRHPGRLWWCRGPQRAELWCLLCFVGAGGAGWCRNGLCPAPNAALFTMVQTPHRRVIMYLLWFAGKVGVQPPLHLLNSVEACAQLHEVHFSSRFPLPTQCNHWPLIRKDQSAGSVFRPLPIEALLQLSLCTSQYPERLISKWPVNTHRMTLSPPGSRHGRAYRTSEILIQCMHAHPPVKHAF